MKRNTDLIESLFYYQYFIMKAFSGFNLKDRSEGVEMTWKYRMMLSRAIVSRRVSWCGNTGSLLYRDREQSLKVKARKRELYRAYTSLRLLEPIKLWIKEASRDGLHDYQPVSVLSQHSLPPLSSPSQPLSTSEKGHGVMLREISLPVHSNNYHRPPSNHPQLIDVNGTARCMGSLGIRDLADRNFIECAKFLRNQMYRTNCF